VKELVPCRARWLGLLARPWPADADEVDLKQLRTATPDATPINAAEPGAAMVATLSGGRTSLAPPLNWPILANALLKLTTKSPLAQSRVNVGLQMKLPLTAACLILC